MTQRKNRLATGLLLRRIRENSPPLRHDAQGLFATKGVKFNYPLLVVINTAKRDDRVAMLKDATRISRNKQWFAILHDRPNSMAFKVKGYDSGAHHAAPLFTWAAWSRSLRS